MSIYFAYYPQIPTKNSGKGRESSCIPLCLNKALDYVWCLACVCACNILMVLNKANNFYLLLSIKALFNHVSLYQPNRWPRHFLFQLVLCCFCTQCLRTLFILLRTTRQLLFPCSFFISKLPPHYIFLLRLE